MEIDVLIPAHPKDFRVLPHSIRSIHDFVTPRVRSITLIARDRSEELRQILRSTHSLFICENDVIPNLKRTDMPALGYRGEDRSGWYFQQFLKLGIACRVETEHYLVVDADTVFIAPTSFFQNGRPLHYRTRQHHIPYFRTYEKLFGYAPERQSSFIANYMLFNRSIVKNLLSDLERIHRKQWSQCILDVIDRNTMSSFSEYESYGYYLSRFHPNAFESRSRATLNLFARFFPTHDVITLLARKTFQSIAYHNYRR